MMKQVWSSDLASTSAFPRIRLLSGEHIPSHDPAPPLVPKRKLGTQCGISVHLLSEYFVLIHLFLVYINYVKYEFHYEISCVYNNSDHIRPHCLLVSCWSPSSFKVFYLLTLMPLLGDPISLIKVTLGTWVWGYSQENRSLLVAMSLKKIFLPKQHPLTAHESIRLARASWDSPLRVPVWKPEATRSLKIH